MNGKHVNIELGNAAQVFRKQFLRLVGLLETIGMSTCISKADLLLFLGKAGGIEATAQAKIAAAIAAELINSGALVFQAKDSPTGRIVRGTLIVVRDRAALADLTREASVKGGGLNVAKESKQ